MKNRFVVISHDGDQQQSFRDPVEADNYKDAMELIGIARPYAIPVDAISIEELRKLLEILEHRSTGAIEEWLVELFKESDGQDPRKEP